MRLQGLVRNGYFACKWKHFIIVRGNMNALIKWKEVCIKSNVSLWTPILQRTLQKRGFTSGGARKVFSSLFNAWNRALRAQRLLGSYTKQIFVHEYMTYHGILHFLSVCVGCNLYILRQRKQEEIKIAYNDCI